MIRIERDPAFWAGVASHPVVRAALFDADPASVGALATRPDVLPLAATHGGFLIRRSDALGLVAELHSLFTPEGWGREAAGAAIDGLAMLWAGGAQVLTTLEVQCNSRSRPARTFGFVAAGPWRATALGPVRVWVLTRAAWEGSPAARRRSLHLTQES